jgi:bacterioferritin
MPSAKLLGMLNNAIADKMQAAIQYMWQHVQWKGVEHFVVTEGFKKIAVDEMKHAEKIAERLWYLGEKPTTQPSPIKVGETLTEMLTLDVKAEEGAIKMYKEIMELAQKEGDVATKEIFEEIEEDEEEHHDFFTSLLEK